MITVMMEEEDVIELLMERLDSWVHDDEISNLFRDMYTKNVYNGIYSELNVMDIVDNDYVNWCTVLYNDDDNYEETLKAYQEGIFELDWGYIEAVGQGSRPIMLIRTY